MKRRMTAREWRFCWRVLALAGPGRRSRCSPPRRGRRLPTGAAPAAQAARCGVDAYGQLEDPALQARFEHITQHFAAWFARTNPSPIRTSNSPATCGARCAKCWWPARAMMPYSTS